MIVDIVCDVGSGLCRSSDLLAMLYDFAHCKLQQWHEFCYSTRAVQSSGYLSVVTVGATRWQAVGVMLCQDAFIIQCMVKRAARKHQQQCAAAAAAQVHNGPRSPANKRRRLEHLPGFKPPLALSEAPGFEYPLASKHVESVLQFSSGRIPEQKASMIAKIRLAGNTQLADRLSRKYKPEDALVGYTQASLGRTVNVDDECASWDTGVRLQQDNPSQQACSAKHPGVCETGDAAILDEVLRFASWAETYLLRSKKEDRFRSCILFVNGGLFCLLDFCGGTLASGAQIHCYVPFELAVSDGPSLHHPAAIPATPYCEFHGGEFASFPVYQLHNPAEDPFPLERLAGLQYTIATMPRTGRSMPALMSHFSVGKHLQLACAPATDWIAHEVKLFHPGLSKFQPRPGQHLSVIGQCTKAKVSTSHKKKANHTVTRAEAINAVNGIGPCGVGEEVDVSILNALFRPQAGDIYCDALVSTSGKALDASKKRSPGHPDVKEKGGSLPLHPGSPIEHKGFAKGPSGVGDDDDSKFSNNGGSDGDASSSSEELLSELEDLLDGRPPHSGDGSHPDLPPSLPPVPPVLWPVAPPLEEPPLPQPLEEPPEALPVPPTEAQRSRGGGPASRGEGGLPRLGEGWVYATVGSLGWLVVNPSKTQVNVHCKICPKFALELSGERIYCHLNRTVTRSSKPSRVTQSRFIGFLVGWLLLQSDDCDELLPDGKGCCKAHGGKKGWLASAAGFELRKKARDWVTTLTTSDPEFHSVLCEILTLEWPFGMDEPLTVPYP